MSYSTDQLEKFMIAAIKDSTSSFKLFLASRGHANKKVDRMTILKEFVVYTDLQWHNLELTETNEMYIEPL